MRKISSLLLTTALLASVASPALAQHWHGHGDYHYFHGYDYDRWRGGGWYHGFHDGRNGWWWMVDGGWYYYPAPVYPYPDPYIPPSVMIVPAPAAPYTAPPSTVYYCANPSGYYPYVADCYGGWQRVASSPAGGPPTVAPPLAQLPPGTPVPPVGDGPMMGQPMAPPMMEGTREGDDRQLNAFGGEFAAIGPHTHHARTKLKDLEARVEAFRQTLYTRPYNAMDIMHDAERLEHRIAAQRAAFARKTVVPIPGAAPQPLPQNMAPPAPTPMPNQPPQ